jgi:DNA-binding NtrC family response regulator
MQLAEYFLQQFAAENGKPASRFDPAARQAIMAHTWPGNIRELENAIERAVVLSSGEVIATAALPRLESGPSTSPADVDPDRVLPLKIALEEPEKRILERALASTDGNRQRAAELLEINRTTLFNKMKKYGLLDHRSKYGRES